MEYKLVRSSDSDVDRLILYKKKTIFEYASGLSDDEVDRINRYVLEQVPKLLDKYFNILVDGKVVGCLLLTDVDDGKLLDEIYLEEEYRGKGIGTDIIKSVIENNNVVYLWVYKDNRKAISLYERLGFSVVRETDSRFYMRCG